MVVELQMAHKFMLVEGKKMFGVNINLFYRIRL